PTAETTGPADGTTFTAVPSTTVRQGGSFTNCTTNGFSYYATQKLVLSDCIVNGSITIFSGATIEFTRVRVTNGIYWESAAHGFIKDSHLSGNGQALRPKPTNYGDLSTETPLLVENSYIYNPPGVSPQHVEAMQSLGGNGYTFR